MIYLSPAVVSDVQLAARTAAPRECCGVLGGYETRDERGAGITCIDAAIAVPNRSETAAAFEADALALAAAERSLRFRRLRLLGHFHSHVWGPPQPSAADLRGQLWPGATPQLHLIVAADRTWRLFRVTAQAWLPTECRLLDERVRPGGADRGQLDALHRAVTIAGY